LQELALAHVAAVYWHWVVKPLASGVAFAVQGAAFA
jgi:hypothetical protein